MEDYYNLLDIDENLNGTQIAKHLRGLRRRFRGRVNNKDSKIKEEAQEKINQIDRAMARLGKDDDRVVYDRELAGWRAEQEMEQPLADINLYELLSLPMDADTPKLKQLIDDLEAGLTAQDESPLVKKKMLLVVLARRELLDEKKRPLYDAQIREKQAFEQHKQAEKPAPITIKDIAVHDWLSLEGVLDKNPYRGLFLLQDGEIEAWLRWSQNQKIRAGWTNDIAVRAVASETPFMEFEEFMRLINANRPLLLYRRGEGPKQGAAVTINHASEILALALANWSLFVTQYDYVINWINQYSDSDAVNQLNRISPAENKNIQLERLLFCLDPKRMPAKTSVEGAPDQILDFGAINRWEAPTMKITIQQDGSGYLYGTISASSKWINLSGEQFTGKTTTIEVGVNRSELTTGGDNQGGITLSSFDGRVPPIKIQVKVSQRTLGGSVKRWFQGKK